MALILGGGMLAIISGCSESQPLATSDSILHLSRTNLLFTALAQGSDPAQQKVLVSNAGVGNMTFADTTETSWIELGPSLGDTIFVTARSSGLPAGTYYGSIKVTSSEAANSPQYIAVTLVVQDWLSTSPGDLTFTALSGGSNPPSQSVTIISFGSGSAAFQATSYTDWISFDNPAGFTPGAVGVYIDVAGLTGGIYTDSVVVTSPDLPDARLVILVTLNLSSWTIYNVNFSSTSLRGVYFLDELNGWVVGFIGNDPEPSGAILKTTDGGESWTPVWVYPRMILGAITFIDDQTAWVAADSARLMYSIDGGNNWTVKTDLPIDSTYRLWDVRFVGSDSGWAAGTGGVVIATVDGGTTWVEQQIDASHDLIELTWVSSQIGWVCGNHGEIFHTTDGGNTWLEQSAGTVADLRAMQFVDENNGWLVGNNGLIMHSADGGAIWTPQISGVGVLLLDVIWANPTTGWAIGNEGTILYTNDGGSNWLLQPSGIPSNLDLFAAFFLNEDIGWVIGDGGAVLRTLSGGF
jgi:photosystem II stability/assembly factor-like uncharacterized protein